MIDCVFENTFQEGVYEGDRSFELLKYFVKDMIKTYVDSTDKPPLTEDEVMPDVLIGEMESVPSNPIPVEAPDTTDDVSIMLFAMSIKGAPI